MPVIAIARCTAAVLLPLPLALALAACGSTPKTPPTLYERLGGTPQLERVVGRLVDRAAADPQALQALGGPAAAGLLQPERLKRSLVQQLCQVAGGGCLREPGATVAGELRINDARFDPLVGLLREELDRAHVPPRAKNELLRVLAPRHPVHGRPPDAAQLRAGAGAKSEGGYRG